MSQSDPRVFSIPDFCRAFGVGRTTAYLHLRAGLLKAIKVGRRTLITRESAIAWLAALPAKEVARG